jgi:hypothetical protein
MIYEDPFQGEQTEDDYYCSALYVNGQLALQTGKKGTPTQITNSLAREEETEGTNISRPRTETARSVAPVMLRGVRGGSLLTGKVHATPARTRYRKIKRPLLTIYKVTSHKSQVKSH